MTINTIKNDIDRLAENISHNMTSLLQHVYSVRITHYAAGMNLVTPDEKGGYPKYKALISTSVGLAHHDLQDGDLGLCHKRLSILEELLTGKLREDAIEHDERPAVMQILHVVVKMKLVLVDIENKQWELKETKNAG